jgi:Flp pilus assembly pilin Flp
MTDGMSVEIDKRQAPSASDESGQTMAEYAVVLAFVTAGVVGVLAVLSGGILGQITRVQDLI